MFRQVFDPENLVWRMVSRGVDFVGLSIFWVALCLPVVTIGPATAALYYTVVKVFRQKEEGAFGVFWRAFCANLRQGILATLLCLLPALALCYGYGVMSANLASDLGVVLYMAYYVVLLLPVGLVCYLFPMMGRFEFPLKGLFRTAFVLAVRHLPSTLVLVLLTVQLTVFCLECWWPVLFAPVLCALLTSLFLERIFPKYLDEGQTAKLENRPPEEN